jgi:PilZ domain
MIEILDGELDALCSLTVVGKRRHTCTRCVRIYLTAGPREVSWMAKTQNISQGGVALVTTRPFDPGLTLIIEVEMSGRPDHCRLEGLVIHATPKGPNLWLVGCKLTTLLNASELQEFLDDT